MEDSRIRGPRDPVMRAFDVLLWMVDAPGEPWGLSEIAKGVAMPPSTLHRVISRLQTRGLVSQDAATGRYRLGLEFMRLTWKGVRRSPIREVALPWMRALVDATQETALLAAYEPMRQQMTFAAVVDSPHPIRHVRQVGEWLPVTSGATGLAIMAFLPEEERRALLSRPITALTPRAITEPSALARALEQIRRQGYALSRGERTPGAVGIAAPILGPDDSAIGAIGVTQPEQRFEPGDERQQSELVIAYGWEISMRFGATTRCDGKVR